MRNTFYITTPIYYVNDVPHIGHTYTTIAADTMARFKRMCGIDTYFLTGTDEHGQKIEQAAAKQGMTPQELADKVVNRYNILWNKLGITNNDFIRTTQERHTATVQYVFEKLLEKGDIYEGEYEGWYCTPCEAFWTETQLSPGQLCPDCGRPTTRMKEPTYFFRMSKYQDKLLKHIEENPDFIRPESRKNEIVSFIKEGLRDLSVSRVTFSWGVKVPSNPKHIIYVWIDALVNYISALGYAQEDDSLFRKYWPANVHLVGKDIIRFHSVYWPTILMALELPLYHSVYAHGWWTVEGQKMSKSLGNVIDPLFLIDKFGVDAVRYFLLREVTFGLDGDFSYKALIHRINGDLANDLGNLVSRSLGMVGRYFEGIIPESKVSAKEDKEIHKLMENTAESYIKYFNELSFNKVLLAVWELVGGLNKYIDDMQPWALAKDPSQKDRLGTVLYVVCDGLRAISHFIAPFMPESAEKIRFQLGLEPSVILESEKELGKNSILKSGGKLGEITAIFPRIDAKEVITKIMEEQNAKKADKEVKKTDSSAEQISIDDFTKISLIAGKIEAAEKVVKSEKLLKLTVNDGSIKRTIVAGISQSYSPEELVGKTVAVLANLKPAKLMGIESHGMVLAAFDGNKHHVLLLPDDVAAGTKIK